MWCAPVRATPGEPRRRIVIFPHSGAGPLAYGPLARAFPPDCEVLGVTLPGREARFLDPTTSSPREVLDAVVDELSELEPCPTVFVGHSLGAHLAVATHLREAGLADGLVLSAAVPTGSAAHEIDVQDESALVGVLSRAGGTPSEILDDPSLRAYVLGVLAADLTLGRRLVSLTADATITVPTRVLGGRTDAVVRAEDLGAWRARVGAPCPVHLFDGGHFFVLDPAHAPTVIDLVLELCPTETVRVH
ncbi:thioesterase II family protein [Cellulomonas sp. P5_C5]